MTVAKIKYSFTARLWRDPMEGGWHFVSLPESISKEIRNHLQFQEEGWGRMKATALVRNHEWKTAIWFDSKVQTYLLPIKAEVRKKKKLELNDEIRVTVLI